MSENKDQQVTADFLSKLFGVTVRNVRQLVEKGILFRDARESYPLVKNIKSYITYLRNRKELQHNSPLGEQKLRLTRANAEKIEIQNKISTGQLVPIELMTKIISDISAQIASSLDVIPAKIKRKNVNIDNNVIDAIKYQIVKAMNSISDIDDLIDNAVNEYIDKYDPE